MSEDEKKDVVEEPQDEGAGPAGPVAAGDPPPPAVAEASSGEVPPTAPPAGEASEEEAPAPEEKAEEPEAAAEEAPAEEEKAEEAAAPAEEKAEHEPNPEDDLPWKERRRLAKSRRPHKAGPQRSVEERIAQHSEERRRKAALRGKQRADAKTKRDGKGAGTPPAERHPNAAKVRQGVVVSNKGEKSITVRVDIVRRHPVYEKVVRSSRTLHAHDERNEANEGDIVRIVETRPLSKTKRWRLVEILEKAR